MRTSRKLLALLTFGGWVMSLMGYSQAQRFGLDSRMICCDKTTESGADEVYLLIVAKKNNGDIITSRYPGPGLHIDMNDGDQGNDVTDGDSHCITNKSFFSAEIKDGESWYITMLIMEEDDGSGPGFLDKLGAAAISTGDPTAIVSGAVLKTLESAGIKDTDDFIGSFGVIVNMSEGKRRTEWQRGERIAELKNDDGLEGHGSKREIRMNGDGTNYGVYVNVQEK